MAPKVPPEETARRFFVALNETKCSVSWGMFTNATQSFFTDWVLKDLYNRNQEAAAAAKLSTKEVRLMFQNNDPSLIKFFWRRFFFSSSASDLFRYGYFTVDSVDGKKAIVKVTLKYPNGQVKEVRLPMVDERGGWKLAYIENKLPF